MANFLDSWRAGGAGHGGYTLSSRSTSEVPLILQLITGQVANGFEMKNALGTTIFSVSPTGDVTYTGSETITDALTVTGATHLISTLEVDGTSTFDGAMIINGEITFGASGRFVNGINVTGNSIIEGATTIHSLTVEGDLTLQSGYLRSKYSANIYLYPSPSTITVVGGANATSHTLNTNSDMFIVGKLEVDGVIYADGGLGLGDNDYLYFGDSNDVGIGWNTAQTVDGWYFGTSDGQNTMIIAELGDIAFDFAHGAQTTPTLFVHSANQNTTQWTSILHNGTNGYIGTGAGNLTLQGATGTMFLLQATSTVIIEAATTNHSGANVMSFDVHVNSASVNTIGMDIDVGTALSAGEIVNGLAIDIDGLAGDAATSVMNGIALTSTNATGGINTAIYIAGTWDSGILNTPGSLTALAYGINNDTDTGFFYSGGGFYYVYNGAIGGALDMSAGVASWNYYQSSSGTVTLRGKAADGANTAVVLDNTTTLTNAAAKLLSIRNNTTEVAYINYLGGLTVSQGIATTGVAVAGLTVTGGAHTGITAATEAIGVNFNLSATKTWATGAGPLAAQREVVFQAPTYAGGVAALTMTKAATVAITNAPQVGANMAITNAYALWVQAGTAQFDGAVVFSSDVDWVLAGNENITIGNTTNTLAAAGMLDLSATTATADTRTLNITSTNTATTGNTAYGLYNTLTSTAVVTGTAQNLYGSYNTVSKTGLDTSVDTTTIYGIYGSAVNTGSTDAGTKVTYGGYFTATGDTAGTATTYGVYATATGGDTNYAGYFNGMTVIDGANFDDDGTKFTILPTTGHYLRIGDATTTSHILNANDDLEVTGELEVDGDLFADGRLYVSGNGIGIAASGYISFATTPDDASSGFYEVTTGNPNLNLWLGTTLRRSLVIGDGVSRGGNFDHAAQNNPTIYLHSTQNPEGDNRQFVKWYNDGSNSYHLTGIGGHRFGFESVIANGIITFTANPTTNLGVVFTVNTGTLTGTTGVPAANQFKIDSTLALTIASIVTNYNLIAGTGVTAHAYGNSVVFEASTAGTTANTYVTTETTDTDGVYSFNSVMTFTANPSTTSGVVFTVGTGTLTGVVGAPGANQFAIGSTLQDTILNLVTAYNNLATGVSAISYGNSIQFVGGTSGISVFTETTDTDNVYSFVATTMHGGREFSAVFEMQPTALAIPATGTATAGTTTYNSATFTTRASGWDTDDSRARDASVRFYAVPSTGASVGVTAYWDFYRDGVLVNNAMNLTGGGALQIGGALYVTGAISGATTLGMAGDLTDYEATNDGSPQFILGSSAAEQLSIQTVYNAGAQTLDYVQFQTTTAGAAGKGIYKFGVDGTDIMTIVNGGITVTNALTGAGIDLNITSTAYTTLVGSLDVVRSGAITGVIGETMIDVSIAPNFVLTEPGAGIFTYAGMSINMANVAVTAGAGGAIVTALYLNASTDADATSNNALYAVGNSIFNGNVGIGAQPFSWGANSATVFAIANGTPPAAHVDNEIQIYSVDSSDATSTLGLMLEQAVEDIGTFTATHKVKILVNGVEYWISLDSVA